jgi:hypothetical protein
MEGYSVWPDDAAPHDPSRLSRPGVAYVEGWATFNGQATLASRGVAAAIARIGGAAVDLERARVNGAAVARPLASTTDDPWATETTVAAVLWALRSRVGDGPLIEVLREPRLLAHERDHGRTDLLDLLDALACAGVPADALASAATAHGYPWEPTARVCP